MGEEDLSEDFEDLAPPSMSRSLSMPMSGPLSSGKSTAHSLYEKMTID